MPERWSESSERAPARAYWGVLLILVLVTLGPRLFNAARQPCPCYDSINFLSWSQALYEGDFELGLERLNVNVYPVILNIARALDVDVVAFAKAWSLLASTLTVVPLFGWLRRQFDDRIAVIGCLLYAFHDAFSADGPLIIRDSTFWLFMASTLYFGWRAAEGLRWRHFIATGVAFTLAAHTRTEGWLLLIPLVGWAIGRACSTPDARRKIVVGAVVAASVTPLFLVAYNVTVLRGHDHWEWGRFSHVRYVNEWLDAFDGDNEEEGEKSQGPSENDASAAWAPRPLLAMATIPSAPLAASPPASSGEAPTYVLDPAEGHSTRTLLRKQTERLVKAVGFVHVFLLAAGLWTLRRELLSRDQVPLLLFAAVNLLAIWIIWRHAMDRRYFLPTTMVLLPYMAAGVVSSARFVYWLIQLRFDRPWRLVQRDGILVVSAVCLVLLILHPRPFEEAQIADFGAWVRKVHGEGATVHVNAGRPGRLQYFAHCASGEIESYGSPEDAASLANLKPDFIIFWRYEQRSFWDPNPPADFRPFVDAFEALEAEGYRRIPYEEISPRCKRFVVLMRMSDEANAPSAGDD